MTDSFQANLRRARIVPLIQSDNPKEAIAIAKALLDAQLNVLEVVLRTDAALDCLKAIGEAFPDACVGAGTVLSGQQADKAMEFGATFIVSPGLHEDVVSAAKSQNVPLIAGIATATELQRAWNMDLRLVKFFPAALSGGPAMVKALSAAFGDMQFVPTGGIGADNLADYLAVKSVVACGGSWLTPLKLVTAGDFAGITKLANQARALSAKQ